MKQIFRKQHIAITIVVIWLVATVFAFWWFQYRNLRPFADPNVRAVLFDSQSLSNHLQAMAPADGDSPMATVVHYWDPACPCNKFNEAHVKDLMRQYGKQGVRFVVVAGGDVDRARAIFSDPAVMRYVDVLPPQSQPPSSPAVAVMDQAGELAYFGPYSVGAVCNVQNGAYVEKVLDGLMDGKPQRQLNTLAVGCFCPWPTVS